MTELGIVEVASVSECISPGPDEWVQAWKHNGWGFFDTPDLAWSLVRPAERADFLLYAYRAHTPGPGAPDRGPPDGVGPLADSFESIGFDVVSRSTGVFFECSPLSCNLLAQELLTNAYCLFDDAAQAAALVEQADTLGIEPGPYFVLEVLRNGDRA